MSATTYLRKIKRYFLTDGFAAPTYRYLNRVRHLADRGNHPPKGKYIVNISFDFELSIGTYFWTNDFDNAKRVGQLAHKNFSNIVDFLNSENIEFNIQIVGMLMDPTITESPFFSTEQKKFVLEHRELFQLPQSYIDRLENEHVDVGLHGYSHKLFTDLTESEAESELKSTIALFSKSFAHSPHPSFFAYPRNYSAHTHLLQKHGIASWRSGNLSPTKGLEMPRGLWFAPGILEPRDLRRLSREIHHHQPGFLLHLWNHFTEMDIETFKKSIMVLKEEGWEFMNIRNYRKAYG